MAIELPAVPADLSIRMPGGPVLAPVPTIAVPTNMMLVQGLLGQANTALAPLAPVFSIIDAILSIKAFADAVPEVVTNPAAVIEAIGKLAEKVAALAALIPQLSIPFLVLDLIDVLIASLQGVVEQLETVVAQEARIAAAELVAQQPGNSALLGVVADARALNDAVMAVQAASAKPINRLIGVANLFLGLFGGPEIPTLEAIGSTAAEAQQGIDTLRTAVEILGTVRSAIPVP